MSANELPIAETTIDSLTRFCRALASKGLTVKTPSDFSVQDNSIWQIRRIMRQDGTRGAVWFTPASQQSFAEGTIDAIPLHIDIDVFHSDPELTRSLLELFNEVFRGLRTAGFKVKWDGWVGSPIFVSMQ